MLKTRNSRVILINSIPGDADLLSVKALKAIRNADVLIHDHDTGEQLLGYASVKCQLISIKKAEGTISDIARLTVDCTRHYHHVVRLVMSKPIDRQYIEYLVREGITIDVVPAVESVLAVLSDNGIPITKRGINESFYVIDGDSWSIEAANNLRLASASSATVIVVNATSHNVKYIAEILISCRGLDEPIGVIPNQGYSGQKVSCGSFRDLSSLTCNDTSASKFLLVIGKVVNESIQKIREEGSSHRVVL
jgi:uroporphyrin-III C-methyltransferase